MRGEGTSYGAISVINAIPCGTGATIGVKLETKAYYEEGGDDKIIEILNFKNMKTSMARICVKKTLEKIKADRSVPYKLTIDSKIPPSRGLKSSSSVCNAIISAVLDYHGKSMKPLDIVKLGVECAKEAGVTITGSFDDACGCHLGGLVITDNTMDKLLSHTSVPEYDVVMLIPNKTIEKKSITVNNYRARSEEFRQAIEIAETDPLKALTLNGRLVGEIIGIDMTLVDKAMELGALAAGVSGTGPAIAVVTEKGQGYRIAKKLGQRYILTQTR